MAVEVEPSDRGDFLNGEHEMPQTWSGLLMGLLAVGKGQSSSDVELEVGCFIDSG
jgi:hypothetical protein